MRIFIRCDGGTRLGTGHIIRQLMMAKELKKRLNNLEITFLMKDIPEGVERVRDEGFAVKELPQFKDLIEESAFIFDYLKDRKPKLLIIDILDTCKEYITTLKKLEAKIVSFDDHSEGKYFADLRFNILELEREEPAPNLFEGPEYVTLNPIYAKYHNKEKEIRKEAKQVLITFGGSDPGNLTNKVLKAFEKLDKELEINVVIGFAFSYIEELKERVKKFPYKVKVYRNVSSEEMAELMFESDVGIGAGGLTQYEFACVGLPGIIICEEVEHQDKLANWFQDRGVFINLGRGSNVVEGVILETVLNLLGNYSKRKRMSLKGKELCDGRGLERTVNKILEVLGFHTCEVALRSVKKLGKVLNKFGGV